MLLLTLFFLFGSIASQTITNLGTQFPQFTVSEASGGFYLPTTNEIIFAEEGAGLISAVYLTPPVQNSTNWTATPYNLAPNTSFDLILGNGIYGGEIRLDYVNPPNNYLSLRPQGSCMLYYVGVLDTPTFSALTTANLQSFGPYTQNSILWSSLSVGSVIAIFDSYPESVDNFNYGKIQITGINIFTGVLTITTNAYALSQRKVVQGSGWSSPVDVIPSVDGLSYYVSEYGTGSIWQVSAGSPSKASASLLFTVNQPQQLALDGTSRKLYVVENQASNGRLWCFDTVLSTSTVLWTGLSYGVGVAGDGAAPFQKLYISEQGAGTISVFDLTALTKTVLVSGLSAPQFLTLNPANGHFYSGVGTQIQSFDFSVTPAVTTTLATVGAASKVVYINPGQFGATGTNFVDLLQLDSGYFNAAGPLLLGFGLVPVTKITADGYATVNDAQYPIHVQDVPFGGTLNVIINHNLARSLGATYYLLYFNNVPQSSPYGDYKWSPSQMQFVYTLTTPSWTYYYPVRSASDLWFNPFWGGVIDTTKVTTGLTNVFVYFFNASWSSVGTYSVNIMIDNVYPQAKIEQIYYYNNGSQIPIDSCAIVQGASTLFNFQITAMDPDNHLLAIGMSSIWGNNQGEGVYSDSYANHASATKLWSGLTHTNVPLAPITYWNALVAGDNTSTHCAHSFILSVWDRSFNGYSYLHSAGYHQSITLLLG